MSNKFFLCNRLLNLAALSLSLALAANATTATISFTASPAGSTTPSTYNGGSITAVYGSTTDVAVSAFTSVPFNELVVSSATSNNGAYKVSNSTSGFGLSGVTESFSSVNETLTVSGSVEDNGTTEISGTLLTIDLKAGSSLEATTNGMIVLDSSAFAADIKSISLSNQFANYFGLSTAASYTMFSDSGTNTNGTSNNWISNSATLNLTAPLAPNPVAPEPISFGLAGIGIGGLLLLRKRSLLSSK